MIIMLPERLAPVGLCEQQASHIWCCIGQGTPKTLRDNVLNMPAPRSCAALVPCNNVLYIIGGIEQSCGTSLKTVFKLDLNENCWMQRADMLTGRSRHVAAIEDSSIIAVCNRHKNIY